jgi:PAS domain S-box-containing protein
MTMTKKNTQTWGRAEDRYRTLFEANFDAIAIHRDDVILDINPAFERLFGWTYEEAIGMKHMPYIDLDQQYAVREHLQTEKTTPLETLGRNRDGETIPIEINGKRIDYQGVQVFYMNIRDLRPMRRAQAELREREALFRTMADTAPVLIWRTDEEAQVDYVNRVWLDFTGTILEDAQGMGWLNSVHDEDRQAVAFMVKSAFDERSDFRIEYRLKHHSDPYHWVLHQGTARYTPQGDFAGYIGSCMDITDRIHSEEARFKNERRMRALLGALPDLLFVLDKDGTYTEAHAKDERALALPAGDIIGTNIRDLPLPQHIIDSNLQGIDITLKTGEQYSFEYAFDIGEEEHFYSAQMVPLNKEEVLALVRDITPLRRTQDELSHHVADLTILRQLDDELGDKLDVPFISQIAMDAAFRITNATSGFIARLDEANNLEPTWWLGNYTVEHLQHTLHDANAIWQTSIQKRQPRMIAYVNDEHESLGLLKNSQCVMVIPLISQERVLGLIGLESKRNTRFNDETYQFLRLVAGRVAGALDNAHLYETTQKQLQELQGLYAQVSKLEQIKTDMIRIASHDLRNPLAGMMGYLEMLRWDIDSKIDESQSNYLDQIEKAARRMQTITTGILSLERIEQLAEQSADSMIDLAKLVRAVAQEQKPHALKKQQSYTQRISDKPVLISGDNYQMHEALTNLVYNAIKYTPEAGKIDIKLATEGDFVVFEVKDTGYGIPETQQERLFSPFFRAKMDETKDIEGTGLGLHLVKNIIERHGGIMAFESERGKGSTFGFQLPLALM